MRGRCTCCPSTVFRIQSSHCCTSSDIQGVSRLVDIIAGGDFLGLCDQKSSCKNLSDFGRLRSYGHFLITVHALVWIASYETSWLVTCSTWWLIICIANIIFATWLAHRESIFRNSTLGRYLRNAGMVGYVGIRLARVHCMTQLLLRVQKPLWLTLHRLCHLLMIRTVRW
jgi:hypothetical protein